MKTSIVTLFILILLSGCKDTPPVVSYENSPTDTSSSDNQTTPTRSTTDNSSPTVSAISPPSGATNISASSDITITFSEDMDSSTINTTNITMVDNASNSINGAVTYSSKVATFNPSSDLNWSTTYTMTVSTGVKDSASNALSSNYSWSFTTASSNSTVRPTVASVTPADGSKNIGISSNITITFSEVMDTSTITTSNTLNGTNITLKDSSGNSVQGVITYSNKVATFNPASNLDYSETYAVFVSVGVTNNYGNALAIPYSWSFTTLPYGLRVLSVSPTNGTANLNVSTDISIDFSDEIDNSTVNLNSISLIDNESNIVEGSLSHKNKVVIFSPKKDLKYNVLYTIIVGTGLKNVNGTSISDNYTANFTTGTGSKPLVLSIHPSNNSRNIDVSSSIFITFNENMDSATIETNNTVNNTNIYLEDNMGNRVSGTITYSDKLAIFNPSVNLKYSTKYNIFIGNGVKSASNNSIVLGYFSSFITSSTSSSSLPFIASVSPYHGKTDIAISDNVSITFNENMNSSTININNISVFDNNSMSVSGSIAYSNQVAKFNPANDLNYSTEYTVKVSNGVKDLYGNNLPSNSFWNFSTTFVKPTQLVYTQTGAGYPNNGGNRSTGKFFAQPFRSSSSMNFRFAGVAMWNSDHMCQYTNSCKSASKLHIYSSTGSNCGQGYYGMGSSPNCNPDNILFSAIPDGNNYFGNLTNLNSSATQAYFGANSINLNQNTTYFIVVEFSDNISMSIGECSASLTYASRRYSADGINWSDWNGGSNCTYSYRPSVFYLAQ